MKSYTKNGLKTVIALALPVILENLMQTLMGTIDIFFAGRIGDEAIAVVGVTALVMNLFLAFYVAIGVGEVAQIARKVGGKDKQAANETAIQSIILTVIVGLVLGAVSLLLYAPILTLCGVDPSLLDYAAQYYFAVAGPSVFLALTLTLSSCFRATGNTKLPMLITGVSVIINTILNCYFLEAGFGILGLGIATTLSRIVSSIILFMMLIRGSEWICLRGRSWVPNRTILGSLSYIGLPCALERLVMRVGQLVYNGMIISLGTSLYVAHTVAGNIEGFSYVIAMGFSTAVAALVGLSLGEGNAPKACSLVKLSSVASLVSLIPMSIVLIFFPERIVMFFTNSTDVIEVAVLVLFLIALFQPAVALSQTLTGALQGAGDTRFTLYTTLLGICVIRIGLGWFLAVPCSLGLLGVWCAYALDLVLRSILLGIRFRRGLWQKQEIMKGIPDG